MEELLKDKFKIVNNSRNDCELMCYVNIDNYILINIKCWSEGLTEDFDGNYETQYDDAGIELNLENAKRLRDELNRLIEIKEMAKNKELCIKQDCEYKAVHDGYCAAHCSCLT